MLLCIRERGGGCPVEVYYIAIKAVLRSGPQYNAFRYMKETPETPDWPKDLPRFEVSTIPHESRPNAAVAAYSWNWRLVEVNQTAFKRPTEFPDGA